MSGSGPLVLSTWNHGRAANAAASDERAANNPWPEWPKVYGLDYGQEEAKEVFGQDPRQYLASTKKFIGDENGRLKAGSLAADGPGPSSFADVSLSTD